jgi:hypothetical protein
VWPHPISHRFAQKVLVELLQKIFSLVGIAQESWKHSVRTSEKWLGVYAYPSSTLVHASSLRVMPLLESGSKEPCWAKPWSDNLPLCFKDLYENITKGLQSHTPQYNPWVRLSVLSSFLEKFAIDQNRKRIFWALLLYTNDLIRSSPKYAVLVCWTGNFELVHVIFDPLY